MSHRVTTQTQITDRATAMTALKNAGIKFEDAGKSTLQIRSGKSTGTLNLTTGEIVGDSDRWSERDFDGLKQHYAVEQYASELRRQGHSIHSTETTAEGEVVIMYQTTG